MKNFLELLGTDLKLDIIVNGKAIQADLHKSLSFDANDTVVVDNIDILPKYRYLAKNGKLTMSQPFYCWYHHVSGQGWLLTPC